MPARDMLSMQVRYLQEENTELKEERNKYREELAKLRLKYVELETRYEALQCEQRDERRAAARQARFVERDVFQDVATTNSPNPRNDVEEGPSEPHLNLEPVARQTVGIIDVDMNDDDDDDPEVCVIGESERPNKAAEPSSDSSSACLNKPQRKRKSSEVEGTLVSRVLKHVKMTEQPTLPLPETDQAVGDSRRGEVERAGEAVLIPPSLLAFTLTPSPSTPDGSRQRDTSESLSGSITSSAQAPSIPHEPHPILTTEVTQRGAAPSTYSAQTIEPRLPPISLPRLCDQVQRRTKDNPLQSDGNEGTTLSEGSMATYLATALAFAIRLPSPRLFWRPFIHKIHGGNPQAFVTRSRDGRRRFIFPMKAVNPYMPTHPGLPGLLLSGRYEMLHNTWTAFHRTQTSPARYLYLGEYRYALAGPLLSDEFARQDHTVKAAWVKQIIGYKEWDVYTKIRARIWLRKNSEALTDENIDQEVERIRASKGGVLLEQDVIASLERGEEHIDVIRMQCVGYDHAFVHDLESRWQLIAQTPAEPGKKRPKATLRNRTGGPDSVVEANPAVGANEGDPNSSSGPSGLRRSSRTRRPSSHPYFTSSDAQSSGASGCDLPSEEESVLDW